MKINFGMVKLFRTRKIGVGESYLRSKKNISLGDIGKYDLKDMIFVVI